MQLSEEVSQLDGGVPAEGGVADVVLEEVGGQGGPVLLAETKLQVLTCLWVVEVSNLAEVEH